jgi:proteasome lid subunit RPN8/RPN11
MRSVELSEQSVRAIRAHARETYPEECCGYLVVRAGEDEASPRRVVSVERARNDFEGERRRRFVIRPEELLEVEARLAGEERAVGGFYHSHPDHPAVPSEFDREHAWPWYSYLVLAVTKAGEGPLSAFELDAESGAFHPAPLLLSAATDWSGGKRMPKRPLGEEGVS